MASEIRQPQKGELELAMTFVDEVREFASEEAKEGVTRLVSIAENQGCRVIYEEGKRNNIRILMPSGEVLDHDFDPRSLDYLGSVIGTENEAPAVYLGLVIQPYLHKHGVL